MDTIQKAVLIGHTVIALLIIVLVLLQRGKGADAGAAFGAGASGTVFGARGSGSFFSRATALCATAFFVTSLTLAYLSSQNSGAPASLLDDAPAIEETTDSLLDDMPNGDAESAQDGMPALETGDTVVDDEIPVLETGDEAVEPVPDSE